MSELVRLTRKISLYTIDEGIYQVFGHFMITSAILFGIFVGIGVLIGSVLPAMAIGSFVWAVLAVGYAKYSEGIANQRGHVQS